MYTYLTKKNQNFYRTPSSLPTLTSKARKRGGGGGVCGVGGGGGREIGGGGGGISKIFFSI